MHILSYNIRMVPIPFLNNGTRKKAIEKCLSKSNFDIICIQENFIQKYWFLPGQRPHEMDTFLKDYNCVYSPMMDLSTKVMNSGLCIYTKYEVLQSRFHPFSKSMNMDRFASKGVLYAKLENGLHVFNTHLQAGKSNAAFTIRRNQLQELCEFITECTCNDKLPIVVAGDFNQFTYSTDLPVIRDQCSRSSTGPTYKEQTLDFIFSLHTFGTVKIKKSKRHPFRSKLLQGKMASDHRGVSLHIILPT